MFAHFPSRCLAEKDDQPAAEPKKAEPKDKEPKEPSPEPSSPAVVKKTALKTPREIELEKKVSSLEDKVSDFETWQAEVNSFLENLQLPGPSKTKSAPQKGGFLDDIAKDLGLAG